MRFKPTSKSSLKCFLDKFTFSCVGSRSFPSQISRDKFCCWRNVVKTIISYEGLLLFAKTIRSISCTFLLAANTNNFFCPKAGMTIGLEQDSLHGKEKLSIFRHTHERKKTCQEKIARLYTVLTDLNSRSLA